jgi:hypothetical protein
VPVGTVLAVLAGEWRLAAGISLSRGRGSPACSLLARPSQSEPQRSPHLASPSGPSLNGPLVSTSPSPSRPLLRTRPEPLLTTKTERGPGGTTMPSFVAALLIAPSSSSVGTSSLVPAAFGGHDSLAPSNESAYERRKSIANGVAQPYRLARNPRSFDLASAPTSSRMGTPISRTSLTEGQATMSGSLGRGPRTHADGTLGGYPSLDNLRPSANLEQLTSQPIRLSPHRAQAGYADALARVLREGGIPGESRSPSSRLSSPARLRPHPSRDRPPSTSRGDGSQRS